MGDALLIFGSKQSAVLYGSSTASLQLKPLHNDGGGLARSVQSINGNAYVVNGNGLTNFTATQAFGDFISAGISRRWIGLSICRMWWPAMVREKAQYRLLMADGSQMTATFIGNQARFSRQRFPESAACGVFRARCRRQ